VTSASTRWARDLASWGIPQHILDAAPRSPWIHPVELFEVDPATLPRDDLSRRRAVDRLPDGGSVLDVGCGGGKASFELVPPAGLVVGVDHQQEMLDAYARTAQALGVRHQEILGGWPEVAADAPVADVAVCHHVAYNVAELAAFARALTEHARVRVVLELPPTHPLSGMRALWRHFWDLERPDGPTAQDAADVIAETGVTPTLELFDGPPPRSLPAELDVEFHRIRLCLPAERDAEVARVLAGIPRPPRRPLAVIWWDC
jgi:SAM-dependent methyltransferase